MKKSIYKLALILGGLIFIAGCEYDFIYRPEPPVVDDPDPGEPVDPNLISFSGKIIPIFTTGNRCTSCHGEGGARPILTASKAYSEIISMRLVNTTDPALSKLYTYVKIGTSPHAWKKYSTSQADLILQWITEGAKNN